jgi:CheY-like chemotaxis protein
MDSQVAAAWIGIIPTLAVLLFFAIVVIANWGQLKDLLAKITRVNVAGLEVELATDDLKNAKSEQPVTEQSASVLEARIARNADAVRGRRVLWADDKPKWNRAERRFLRSAGVWVENVTSTGEALTRLQRDEYDAVITNQSRGRSNRAGEDLAEQARAAGEHVPVVAYVGKLDDRPTPAVFHGITNKPDELVHLLLDVFERTAEAAE